MKKIKLNFSKGAIIALFVMTTLATALENGLARTPPMGWNSWNHFKCEGINENLFKEMVDAMVSNGMQEVGYEYLNIDDCWSGGRDDFGDLIAADGFTNNTLKPLADYVHNLGLKLGTYGCAGRLTCQNYQGSFGREEQDAAVFASWEIDYIKWDYCNTVDGGKWWEPAPKAVGIELYTKMRDAIAATGRPMVFSICSWGKIEEEKWAPEVGNLWRTTNDIALSWDDVKKIVEQQVDKYPYSKPGAWNDPDMLEVGRGMSKTEDQTHFGMWCMFAAPLIMGNDLRYMDSQDLGILTNKEAISVDQDPLGIQAQRISGSANSPQVWIRPLVNKGRAVALYNPTNNSASMSFSVNDLNTAAWTAKDLEWKAGMKAPMRDIWGDEDMPEYTGQTVTKTVPAHGMAFMTIREAVTDIADKKAASARPIRVNVHADYSSINVTLPFTANTSSKVEVHNTGGKLVTSFLAADTYFELSTEGYANGVYIMKADNRTQSSSALFTINR